MAVSGSLYSASMRLKQFYIRRNKENHPTMAEGITIQAFYNCLRQLEIHLQQQLYRPMQAYMTDLPDVELFNQQRQYHWCARQRTQSLIGQLQARLFSLDSTLSRHPTPKRERKRLQQARWKANKQLQVCVNEEQVISSNLRELEIKMQAQAQAQAQTHFQYSDRVFGSFSSSSNTQWVSSEDSGPVDVQMLDQSWETYPTSETYEWSTPEWQAQPWGADQLPDNMYNANALNFPMSFQYPYETMMLESNANFDAAFGTLEQSASMTNGQTDQDETQPSLQPIPMPGFESFAWDHPSEGPQQWINPRSPSSQRSGHARIESAIISPRTIKRPNQPAPISTVLSPTFPPSGASSANTLRAEAPPFTPMPPATWSCPVSLNVRMSVPAGNDVSAGTAGRGRRYSAAAVDLIQYKIRQSNDRLRAKMGKYEQLHPVCPMALNERTWAQGHKKSYSVPPRFG
ncbi:hypothetical protein NA57DRAFT_71925 [Rhizodiscina lignyota]|uniref:Uncharacterized protein n=1 Tax=Rhizodiscina lignyota TaxID=1504668 RepID=A0A9P4M9Q4_9PEZI|nr:hypothetical protein NA57DRAFT_71925 [Rhizodiscina lignyota]